ncbi:MAG: LytR C-terminal domain-containing protein [Candidatus Eisenbacteria bacterium]|nr:LytR C-terminal domain-containing protein [Candidatus Eisenbacteria bacterium]MCC7143303.1 LytR C-terminal domain-containing protein [Candidatus Eisenbacteria bacterium]
MARKKKKGGFWEGLFVGMLLLVILVFGISIADRWRPGATDRNQALRMSYDGGVSEASGHASSGSAGRRAADDASPVVAPPSGRATLVVQNGTEVPGLALEATRWLRKSGFDVVDYGNAGALYAKTVLIDLTGKGDAPERLLERFQSAYGVGSVEREVAAVSGADVRIILGADFAEAWTHPQTQNDR